MTDKDIKHLEWVYERMVWVHKEIESEDYMIRFREIIKSLNPCNGFKQFSINEVVYSLKHKRFCTIELVRVKKGYLVKFDNYKLDYDFHYPNELTKHKITITSL